jgi:hypothetical protein
MFKKEKKGHLVPRYYTRRQIHVGNEKRGEYWREEKQRLQEEKNKQTLPRTSVVLLLLVIVAELPLTLSRHPTLCLHHLLYFIGTALEALRRVEALQVGVGVHPRSVEVADGVVALGHGTGNAGVCPRETKVLAMGINHTSGRSRTEFRVGATHHHGH